MVRKKTGYKNGRRVIAIIATAVIVAAAVLVFLYRDELFNGNKTKNDAGTGGSEPFTYENGSDQVFDLMGNCLAVSSTTGLQLLDSYGYTLSRQVFTMKNPALSAGDKHCVFYDIGGTALRLYSDGEIISLDTSDNIISVSMNKAGYFAVTAEKSGYKGSVTVYDPGGNPVYRWDSGTGYTVDAALSPDSSSLAVLCLEPGGSIVHLFKLNVDSEAASVSIPDELAFKVVYSGNNSFCTLSEDALRFWSADGNAEESMLFASDYLIDFSLSDSLCVVALSKYVSGSSVNYTSFSPEGKTLGTATLEYPPLSLSQCKQKLLVLGNGTAVIFSRDQSVSAEAEVPVGYSDAVYLPDGDILLLSSYHAEKISVR